MTGGKVFAFAAVFAAATCASAAEYFVSPEGDDAADGSRARPWRTIQRAADVAAAGDTVTIRGGVYREWVKPANAGRPDAPITYRAAAGEKVVVTGADPVAGWRRRPDGLWETRVACGGQGSFNPFTDFISGDWFVPKKGRRYFRTRLVQNGKPLELFGGDVLIAEKAKSPALMRGQAALVPGDGSGSIVAAFHDDPNVAAPELAVRPACFYPVKPHRDFIHLNGIAFRDAAPNWAPPTAEQMGVVGTHWSQGWTIEDCEISGSPCAGLTLGKYGDEYDNIGGTAENHAASILRAMTNGVERVGRHTVRRCRISDCGQVGICGAFGGAFSVIEDCDISYCYWQKEYYGAEMGCIKLHNAVDAVVQRCKLHHCGFAGIWLDWMAQGAIVRNNVFWHNERDLYLEVNHGPILVEGNDILSGLSFKSCGQGVAFVGNRIAGAYRYWNDVRRTPICKPHSVVVESPDSVAPCGTGDLVFINNMLAYDPKFAKEEYPSRFEDNWMIPPECWKVDDATGVLTVTPPTPRPAFKPVDAKRLGRPHFVDQPYPEPTVAKPRFVGTPPPAGVYGLSCEYMREPLGVVKPRFFWKYSGERPAAWKMSVRDGAGVVATHETAEHLYVEPPLALVPWKRYWWSVGGAEGTFVAGIEKWRMPFFRPGWKHDEREYWIARRKVSLRGATSVVVSLCSRGNHRLYVNGVQASDGYGPNRSHIEDGVLLAETYDVTRLVKDGENDFAVFVDDGWLRIRTCSEDLTSCLSVDGRAETADGAVAIDSSSPWTVSRSGDRIIGGHRCSSHYKCGEHLCDPPVETDAQAGVAVTGEVFSVTCSIARRDELVREIKPVSIAPCGDGGGGAERVWKIDMGEAFTGFMRLRLKGRKGDVAKMTVSDNFVDKCNFEQAWEYEFCGGDGVFENRLNWMAGRFFYLSGCERPSPEDVTGKVLTCVGRPTGGFEGDVALEKVLALDNDTFVACTLCGVTMDCPHRERLGYGEASLSSMWGDGLPYFDSAAFYAAYLRKWASSQRPDGSIPQVSPDGRGWGGIFWSCYPIYGLADFCKAYPDRRLVDEMRPAIEKWLDFLHGHVKYGILHRYDTRKGYSLGDWAHTDTDTSNWGDWGHTREGSFFNNAAYAWALLRALETPGLVRGPARREELKRRHAALAAAIDHEWFKDGLYVSANARYQAIGLVCGAAEAAGHGAETERATIDIVERKGFIDGGSPSYHVILRVLCCSERGRSAALRVLRSREYPGYLHFADEGFNLLPEHWRYGRGSRGSMMHTCYTGAAGTLMRGFAGIDVDGGRLTIAPFLSDALPCFAAHTETLYGTVAVRVETRGGRRDVEILCPAGCKATLVADGERPLSPGLNRLTFPVPDERTFAASRERPAHRARIPVLGAVRHGR